MANAAPLRCHSLALAAAVSAVFLLLLCSLFTPAWETNDDVAMSMVAHGYGIAARGSPDLIFSSVIWGHLVRALPTVGGIVGYSLATLAVLFAVCTAILYGMYRLGVGIPVCLAMLILVMMRPILFPQFTINAGLLLVAALVCWHVYLQHNNILALVSGCVLAFLSYLVRSHEFLLVLLVSLPLIRWRAMWLRPVTRVALTLLVAAILVAVAFDARSYKGGEWTTFNQLNPARAAFTDFGVGEELKKHPDILKRHGFSANDVDLVSAWFFVDPSIANPRLLRSMLDELGVLPVRSSSLANAWLSLQSLWHPDLRPLLVTALILALMRPSWRITISWLLCLASIATMGGLGRPSILRVYVPLLSLLAVAPFIVGKIFHPLHRLLTIIVVGASIISVLATVEKSRTFELAALATRKEFAAFPAEAVAIWGDSFPFEMIYPVLGATPSAMAYRLYGLGVFTWAPFSVAFAEQERHRGAVNRLKNFAGMPFLSKDWGYSYLEKYCNEHHNGSLKETAVLALGNKQVSWRRCDGNNSAPPPNLQTK